MDQLIIAVCVSVDEPLINMFANFCIKYVAILCIYKYLRLR